MVFVGRPRRKPVRTRTNSERTQRKMPQTDKNERERGEEREREPKRMTSIY